METGSKLAAGLVSRTMAFNLCSSLIFHRGPAHYAAPEIILGHLYGVEVDVWSCGAILSVLFPR